MSASKSQMRRWSAAKRAVDKEMRDAGLDPAVKADRDLHLAKMLDDLRYLPDGTLRQRRS